VIDDRQLEAAFIEIINQVIEKPGRIEKRPAVKPAAKSLELNKLTGQITNGLQNSGLEPAEIARLLFQRAAEQYRLSRVDDFEHQTRKLKAVLQNCRPVAEFDKDLFTATIKSITVFTAEQLRFELINGVMLDAAYKLRRKGGNNHGNGTKNSFNHTSQPDL